MENKTQMVYDNLAQAADLYYVHCFLFIYLIFLVQFAQFQFHIQNSDYCLIIFGFYLYCQIPSKISCYYIGLPKHIIITYQQVNSLIRIGQQVDVTIQTKYILCHSRARLSDTIDFVISVILTLERCPYVHYNNIYLHTVVAN